MKTMNGHDHTSRSERSGGVKRSGFKHVGTTAGALAAILAAVGAFGACAVPAGEEGVGSENSAIWANSPGVRITAQNLPWEPIVASGASSRAAVAAYALSANGPNMVHTLFFDGNQCLQHYYENEQVGAWTHDSTQYCADLGSYGPSAVAWDATGRIDIFWFDKQLLTPQTALMHRWTDGTNWYTETLLAETAVPAASATSVASWGTGHLDVFWRDQNNNIKWLGFDRSKKGASGYTANGWFTAERTVATGVTGDPAAVERAVNAIDLYWTSGGVLQHDWTQNGGTNWSGGQSLGVAAAGAPSATTWGTGRIDTVYPVDATHIGHSSFDSSSGTWVMASETLASTPNVGTPVAVSAPGRANRIDVFGQPAIGALSHTLFQNSLPGYNVVIQPNAEWCWAASAASVIDYETLVLKGTNPNLQECALVNLEKGRTDCCTINPADTINGVPNTSACLVAGSVETLLTDYKLSYSTSANNAPLSAATLKSWLWDSHQPVVSHHTHKTVPPGGHYVVITDMYELNGKDMVVISDPNSGNYVEAYSDYVTNPCGIGTPASCDTIVDYMLYDFHF